MLSAIVAWIVRVWLALLRVRVVAHPALAEERGRLVWAFWHGTQMALLARPRRRATAALVSLSRDGELQAGIMRRHGLVVVRGSSSRRGAGGLRGLVRELRRGRDVAFAVDGPRGPRGVAKPGALACARMGGARVVPVGVAASRAWVLRRAWDRFVVPWPLSRVAVVLGAPLDAEATAAELGAAIDAANREARQSIAMASISTRAPFGSAQT